MTKIRDRLLAFEGLAENCVSRPPPIEAPSAFVDLVRREIVEADRRAREPVEQEPEQIEESVHDQESVQVEGRKPEKPARVAGHRKKPYKRKSVPPTGMTMTRTAELWLVAIGRHVVVADNVPAARSIMFAAAKNKGLKIRTEHRGHGIVVGTVIDP